MFEEYLQDAYQCTVLARDTATDREARRFYRAAVFYTSGAMESFVNYVADSFAKADVLGAHEVAFLNDKTVAFTVDKGIIERIEYHRLDDKVRLLFKRFSPAYNFQSADWCQFLESRKLRDSLVHPRQTEDETSAIDYAQKVTRALRATLGVMNALNQGIFNRPLRALIMDLMPD